MPALFNTASGNPGFLTGPMLAPSPTSPSAPTQRPSGSGGGTGDYRPFQGVDLYGEQLASATKAYNDALAQLKSKRMSTLHQYGYTGTVDPTTGHVGGVKVDPNAPFGLYQQQLHANAVEDVQAQNQMNDRGIFGGLAHQAETNLRYSHGAAAENLGTSLLDQLSGFDQEQQQAEQALSQAKWAAMLAQIQADIAAGNYNTASGGGDSGGGDTGGGSDTGGGANPRAAQIVQKLFTPATRPTAVRVSANKTGASRNKKQGIFAIH